MKRRAAWLWLGMVVATACGRQMAPSAPAPQGSTELPFAGSPSIGVSPTQAFGDISLPVGTLVVVRLQAPISSVSAKSGDQFQAELEEPVSAEGQTFAATGAAVGGTVMAAQASGARRPGYLRLTLSSIVLNGKSRSVHTSSVFRSAGSRTKIESRGDASGPGGNVHFSTGRRLTFRLVEPLVASQ